MLLASYIKENVMKKIIVALISVALVIATIVAISLVVYTAGRRNPEGLRFQDEQQLAEAAKATDAAKARLATAAAAATAFAADAKNFRMEVHCTPDHSEAAKYDDNYAALLPQEELSYTCSRISDIAKEAAGDWRIKEKHFANQVKNAEADLVEAKKNHAVALEEIATTTKAGDALKAVAAIGSVLALILVSLVVATRKK